MANFWPATDLLAKREGSHGTGGDASNAAAKDKPLESSGKMQTKVLLAPEMR